MKAVQLNYLAESMKNYKKGEDINWRKIFVYGMGGHGKVVADAWLSREGARIDGFIDDRSELQGQSLLGITVAGGWKELKKEAAADGVGVILGIGDNQARKAVAERCLKHGIGLITVVHTAAIVAQSSYIENGTVVMAGAIVNPNAKIGCGTIINTGAIVEHDSTIGDWAHLSPNATIGGTARLGNLSHLGLGAVVLPNISIGSKTIVGAGAVVNRNLPDGVIAFGVPARIRRQQKID